MNRNRFRLVFKPASGMTVPVAESARSRCKTGRTKATSGPALALTGILLIGNAQAELPVASATFAAPGTTANYQFNAMQAWINQVGNKAVVNFDKFNISAGHDVRFQQVDSLAAANLVPGASFSVLGRIYDNNPSIIAGSISQGAGQQANVILVNSNGIAFMGGSQVNLHSFTASTLNLDDKYIYGALLTNDSNPQFEGSGGFIKVFEGARITAGSQGRVMLLAPTVVNKGTVKAPDGQVIVAAGTKVYLSAAGNVGKDRLGSNVRGLLVEVDSPDGLTLDTANTTVKDGILDGETVDLTDAAVDKLGHVTNLGELTTPRGNVTMIGYAVNQNGIARATTSVVANGSVYLLAKDEAVSKTEATRGGRVTLGAGSLTEVRPDTADATGALDGDSGQGLAQRSQVWVVGQTINMDSGAAIHAPSADVNLIALDNPGQIDTVNDPFNSIGAPVSAVAKVNIANRALIDVAGLKNVQVSAARNGIEVELRGDELKDSPVNRDGQLRGQKVYLDVNRALARANAGESTLISKDSLESYQAKLERTVAERSTAAGTVTVKSQGTAILDRGATIDLSGGSVEYTAANMKKTILYSGGTLVDLADANAETRYDGIATRYVVDYGRWNRKEVIDLGQSFSYEPGYIEGKDAGALNVIGMQAVQLQAAVQGKTITGTLQGGAGIQPKGATLKLGSGSVANDYKLNQKVVIGATTLDEVHTLALDAALFGKDKIAHLEVFSNQAAEVREAMRLPQGGSVAITAKGVAVNADVEAGAGTISFNARSNGVDIVTVPLDVMVADGVTLSARGGWANDLPTASGHSDEAALVNGGKVTLSAAEDVTLGAGSLIDVTGGARVKPDGKLKNGNGGNVTLGAGAGASAAGSHTASVRLGGEVRGYAPGKGGSFSINTAKIQIGGVADPAALNLDAGFVARGGFANFNLTGRDGVTVADGVSLTPRVESLELQPGYTLLPTGGRIESVARKAVREDRIRQAANLTLSADGTDFGVVKIGNDARIQGDDRASLAFKAGKRIEIQGQVATAGGSISASLSGDTNMDYDPTNTIWLGPQALLDASGAARTYLDSKAMRVSEVLDGGTVALNAVSGFVVTEAGSIIRTNGVAPVLLDVPNEAGGLGRIAGSDAGTIRIAAREGALLDGSLQAQAGSLTERGGRFEFTLGNNISPQGTGYPTATRIVSLAPTTTAQATGRAPGAAVPGAFNGQAKLGANALEAAGFESIALKSRDAIRLENGLDLGGARSAPLREIRLDAPQLQTAGGDAALAAHTIRLGNYDAERQDVVNTPAPGTGTLRANAQLLELAGNQTLSGMARAELSAAQKVRLAGVSTSATPRPTGALTTAADLAIHGALVAPATYAQYTLDATGRRIEFSRTALAPVQPLSALGSLTVKARDIVQGGSLWVPFGQIDLQASNSLVFREASLTSVSAASGSLAPFGKVENGRDWIVNLNGVKVAITEIPQKIIRTQAPSIDMQSGAQVNLAGGGDAQAYEFTVGPGGSRDILADANTYAILPDYKGGFAPADAQEGFDRASGEAVYLSGVPGLKDGVYTLLPAHYALLPGAYAVKLDNSGKEVLPHQAYGLQDGVHVAAGYVTDTRTGAPRDARWQGIQVLTHEQVRARSEFTLTRASEFFDDSRNRPQDAGLLSISSTGSGANALKLDAIYNMAAGAGGRGGQVDISTLKLAVTSGAIAGLDPDTVVLDAGKLNALGAESLFIGGTRTVSADTTTLTVGAETLTLANDASHTLKAAEIMLAAKDTLTLKAGSAIDAQGDAGNAGAYETAGNGAFVRAASTSASFSRTGSPDRTKGTLIGEPGSQIIAADSIMLDATRKNDYRGSAIFSKNGIPVAGNLAIGAERVNFGAAPATAEGITYSQAELNAFSDLKGLTLTSYSTFDLYGGVKVGGLDASGKPTLQNFTLQGAGLAGIDNAGQTAQVNAQNLTLTNPQAAAFTPGGALGTGALAVNTDTLMLGKGDKAIQGFNEVTITTNELVGTGTGTLAVTAPVTLNVARISGERGADQAFTSSGTFNVVQRTADRMLAPVTALGAKWALQGTAVDFDSHAELPSGTFKLTATAPGAHVTLKENARIDVAGRNVTFFDVSKPGWGGTAEFVSEAGDVNFNAGAKVDVSAAAGGDAGTLNVRATQGKFNVADGIHGAAPADVSGKGARALLDVKELTSFSTLNTALNSGGFDGERDLRVRTGNVSIAASDTAKALNIRIAADGGKLDVAGTLDASGKDAGRIELFAKNDVNIMASASLDAASSGANEDGGDIEIGSREGFINLPASDSGKGFNVAGGVGGQGGTVLLRGERTATDVKIGSLASSGLGSARSVSVEAVKVYHPGDIGTLDASGNVTLTAANLATINSNDSAFAANHATIKTRLGAVAAEPNFHILSGVEIRSAGNLTLAQDWNLKDSRAGGEAGVLTLRADGNLKINSNLSDGFSHATPCTTGTCAATSTPATLLSDSSWSYRVVAGADNDAANPLSVIRNESGGNVTLAVGKLVRTGTGYIRVAAGGNIELKDNKAAIYSAGRAADALASFTVPADAQFSQGGGDVSLAALGDITGAPSAQLYSNWLFRQGDLDGPTQQYLFRESPTELFPEGELTEIQTQPAWWVRFDQFQQGVAALGGGDVSIKADGRLQNLSASTPTQARMTSTTPDAASLVKTGGGDVRIETGGDLEGGQYYADNGELVLRSGGKLVSGQSVGIGASAKPLYTILALGDAQAKVQARSDINLHAIINPHLVVQSSGAGANVNVNNAASPLWSVFSTYGEDSAASLASLAGAVNFHNAPGGSGTLASMTSNTGAYRTPLNFAISSSNYNAARAFAVLPSSLHMTAFQGDVLFGGTSGVMRPAATGDLDLLASGSISLPATLTMSDMAPMPDAVRPASNTNAFSPTTLTAHATQPVHAGDTEPVRLYALAGDVTGAPNKLNLNVPKAVRVKAGRDVRDLGMSIQHVNAADISQVEAGRDVVFSSLGSRSGNAYIWVAGPGRLEVTAGRNVDLGTSAGIVSRGNLDNVALPSGGADIHVSAGVGPNGVDYSDAVDRLLAALRAGSPDDNTLWLARWLTGDDSLTVANAESAMQSVAALDADDKRSRVRELVYTALRTTGRDSLDKASPYAADYARGYAALELLFPGIRDKNPDGSYKNYQGEINLFASRILTERGGNIEFMAPGGDVVVGLSNTPAVLLATQVPGSGIGLTDSGVLGMATVADGSIRGFARDDILVNQSRILTVGGGDVLLWSSEGDIDAGKGKKTAATVPPPLTLVDAQGNVTQVLQGAASGSGIGALQPAGGIAGDVDLIAPKGTINAGDAGIRAGNLNIAAQVVLGADNITVSGTSTGTPVADTSAVTAASSGASNAGGDVSAATAALSQNIADAARAAEELKQAFKPTFISAEVIGHGE